VFQKCLEKLSPGDYLPVLRALGQIPQGTPGECIYRELCQGAEAFALRVLPFLEGPALEPVEVDFSLAGFSLKGRIENIYSEGLLHYRYAKPKAKDRLRLWIYHLLLNFLRPGDYPCHGTLICRDEEFSFPPVDGSQKILKELLEIYWVGLTRPLHFFPDSSWTYADNLRKGKGEEKALENAQVKWIGSDHNRGEGEDSYYQLCFGKIDPLNEEFKTLSLKVFDSLLKFKEKVKN
jgi:exodeoxyribonuclease V gamma subunit